MIKTTKTREEWFKIDNQRLKLELESVKRENKKLKRERGKLLILLDDARTNE